MTHWQTGMRLTPARMGAEEIGTVLVSFTTLSSYTQVILFAEAFSTVPVVLCGIASGSGVTGRFEARAINPSTTQFTLFVLLTDTAEGPDTWVDQPVNWHARAFPA